MKSALLTALICLVFLPAKSQTIIFSDDFESGSFGPKWVASAGTPNGVVSVNTAIGNSGTRGVRMGKTSAAGGFVTNTLDLKLDLESFSQSDIALTFDIQDRSDETHFEDGVFFSDDGGATFKKAFAFNPSLWCDGNYGTFPPLDIDALADSLGLSLTGDFVIRFQQYGDNSLPNSDGFYLDNVSVFVQNILYFSQFPFLDDFENSFDLSNVWTRSFPTQTNTQVTDPNRPLNVIEIGSAIGTGGSRGVRMGKDCSDGFSTNALDLHLDLSGGSDYELTFDIQDRSDETHADDGLYFSNDGGVTFKKVFDFNPSLWCDDNYGAFPPFDIDALADSVQLGLSSKFVIRFQQHGSSTLPNSDGFYLDNVSVYVPNIVYQNNFPFTDNFESGPFGPQWKKSFPDKTNTLVADPNRPNNIIELGSGIGTAGSRGVRMGKGCSDGFSTNALDLHLDLSSGSDYELTFDIQDRSDETHADDGLYFSNDGGVTFKKVFDFNPSLWCDDNYGAFPPFDIDALADSVQLGLSSKFVIRFQQHGNSTLPNSDGFYLDNVSVYVPNIVYENNFPFTDNFENGVSLGPQWKKSFPDKTNTLVADPNRPNNIIELANGIGAGGSRGVRIGKDCSDGFSTNALDLHLDLSNIGQVMLSFKIQDRSDETHADDAVYFSDNGGADFQKVYAFDFGNTPNVYQDYSLDLDSLATAFGLSFSSRFIIRFQQHGESPLPNSDGIYLDEVNIMGTVGTEETSFGGVIKIYPNPVTDVLYLDMKTINNLDGFRYQVRDCTGKIILSNAVVHSTEIIDTGALADGLYLIEVIGKKGSSTLKFLKM